MPICNTNRKHFQGGKKIIKFSQWRVKMFLIMFLFRDSISFWSPKWRFAVASRMCSWYRWAMLSLGIIFSCISLCFWLQYVPLRHPSRGIFPYTKLLWRTTWKFASTRTTFSPRTCKQHLRGGRIQTAPALDPNFCFLMSALEVWRSTTAMGRSKCPTPWRAGWTSWLSR